MTKTILMYHCVYRQEFSESGFQDGNAWQYKVQVDNFEAQVKNIAEYCDKNNIARESVVLTFDDGGVSFITIIAPILEKYGFRGIFYISTKYIGTEGFLTQEQIKELYVRGHKIASHSHTHPKDISGMTYDDVLEEWAQSKSILENIIQDKVLMASIPNGNGSKIVYDTAVKAGFEILDTSIPTTSEMTYQGLVIRGRFVVHNQTSLDDVIKIVSSNKARKALYYKWKCLSLLKMLLGSNYDRLKAFVIKN